MYNLLIGIIVSLLIFILLYDSKDQKDNLVISSLSMLLTYLILYYIDKII